MVLVPYKLFNILRTINTNYVVFGLAAILRLFHAGRRDIPAMRGEPYDDREARR